MSVRKRKKAKIPAIQNENIYFFIFFTFDSRWLPLPQVLWLLFLNGLLQFCSETSGLHMSKVLHFPLATGLLIVHLNLLSSSSLTCLSLVICSSSWWSFFWRAADWKQKNLTKNAWSLMKTLLVLDRSTKFSVCRCERRSHLIVSKEDVTYCPDFSESCYFSA